MLSLLLAVVACGLAILSLVFREGRLEPLALAVIILSVLHILPVV